MPKQYEDIRNSYLDRGKPVKEAKRLASMTFIKNGAGGNPSSRASSLHDKPKHKMSKLLGGK
jgi:hypothetical protein